MSGGGGEGKGEGMRERWQRAGTRPWELQPVGK